MHLVGLVHRHTEVGGFKVVMKAALKWVPIANCGIHQGFVTVERGGGQEARSEILNSFKNQGAQLCRDNVPSWLVIFPEGTWITPNDLEIKSKANAFAQKAGYPELRNVLFPRANGFCALLDGMRSSASPGDNPVDAVYDVTVAYNKPYHSVHIGEAFPPSVLALVSGSEGAPKEVHFHITRHPTSMIPISEKEAATWLCDRFAHEKEALLDQFAENRCFPGPDRSKPLVVPILLAHHAFLLLNLWGFYSVVNQLLGPFCVIILLGLGALAAIAAAKGDKKVEKAKNSKKTN